MALPLFTPQYTGGAQSIGVNDLHQSLVPPTCTLKYAAGANYYANNTNFWARVAEYGAHAPIVAADTWVTVCDVTGSGYLYNAISPAFPDTTANQTLDLELTVDGDITTFSVTVTSAPNPVSGDRLALGLFGHGLDISASISAVSLMPNTVNDPGFSSPIGGLYKLTNSPSLIHPRWYGILGLPRLPFSTDLKIRARASRYLNSAAAPSAGAIFEVN